MKYPKEYLDEIKLRLKAVVENSSIKKRGKEFIDFHLLKMKKVPPLLLMMIKNFITVYSGEHKTFLIF